MKRTLLLDRQDFIVESAGFRVRYFDSVETNIGIIVLPQLVLGIQVSASEIVAVPINEVRLKARVHPHFAQRLALRMLEGGQ